MPKRYAIVLIVVAGIVFLLAYPKAYLVRGSAGATLYWNSDEALVFMVGASSGAHMSYVRYALEPFLEGMGYVRPPDNERCSLTAAIQITDKDVQRYDTDLYRYAEEPYCGMRFAVFEGQIYTGYLAKDKIWKWSGTHFDPATPEELRAFDTAKVAATTASRPHPWEFDNVDGWSMRELGQTIPKNGLVLRGQPVTIIFSGRTRLPQPLSVDVIRIGQSPQRIWSFDEEPHRVSKTEYEKIFGNH